MVDDSQVESDFGPHPRGSACPFWGACLAAVGGALREGCPLGRGGAMGALLARREGRALLDVRGLLMVPRGRNLYLGWAMRLASWGV